MLDILSPVAVCIGFLVLWELVTVLLRVPPYILPSPLAVIGAVVQRFPSLVVSLEITSVAAAGGLAASTVAGVLVAIVFAQSRWIRRLFFPYTILLQTVPIVAIAPLILIWVGTGTFAVGVITFIICLPPIIANTTQGLISVDQNLVRLFLMLFDPLPTFISERYFSIAPLFASRPRIGYRRNVVQHKPWDGALSPDARSAIQPDRLLFPITVVGYRGYDQVV